MRAHTYRRSLLKGSRHKMNRSICVKSEKESLRVQTLLSFSTEHTWPICKIWEWVLDRGFKKKKKWQKLLDAAPPNYKFLKVWGNMVFNDQKCMFFHILAPSCATKELKKMIIDGVIFNWFYNAKQKKWKDIKYHKEDHWMNRDVHGKKYFETNTNKYCRPITEITLSSP